MLRVRAFLAADDDDEIDIRVLREDAGSVLVFLRRVADRVGALYMFRKLLDAPDDVLKLVGVQGRLVENLDSVEAAPIDFLDVFDAQQDVEKRGIEVVGIPDHLAMFRVADEDEMAAVGERILRLAMDVVDELAGGIEDVQSARLRVGVK